MNDKVARSNKVSLLLILGIPVAGIVLTTIFYMILMENDIRMGTSNSGVLISPPKQINTIEPKLVDGSRYDWLKKEDRWTFMVVGGETCNTACAEQMKLIRQIRLAMGKYMLRMDTLYLNLDGKLAPETAEWLKKEHETTQIFNVNGEDAKRWFMQDEPKMDLQQPDTFFVIDPAGWVMMYYTPEQNYKSVIKDMKFLLKNA